MSKAVVTVIPACEKVTETTTDMVLLEQCYAALSAHAQHSLDLTTAYLVRVKSDRHAAAPIRAAIERLLALELSQRLVIGRSVLTDQQSLAAYTHEMREVRSQVVLLQYVCSFLLVLVVVIGVLYVLRRLGKDWSIRVETSPPVEVPRRSTSPPVRAIEAKAAVVPRQVEQPTAPPASCQPKPASGPLTVVSVALPSLAVLEALPVVRTLPSVPAERAHALVVALDAGKEVQYRYAVWRGVVGGIPLVYLGCKTKRGQWYTKRWGTLTAEDVSQVVTSGMLPVDV